MTTLRFEVCTKAKTCRPRVHTYQHQTVLPNRKQNQKKETAIISGAVRTANATRTAHAASVRLSNKRSQSATHAALHVYRAFVLTFSKGALQTEQFEWPCVAMSCRRQWACKNLSLHKQALRKGAGSDSVQM